MSSVNVTWRGDQVLADIAAAVEEGMHASGRVLAASTVKKVSTPYPPASRPGQPPHRRSGGLAGEIGAQVQRQGRTVTLSVGVPSGSRVRRQAEALQRGTGRMAARPFMPTADTAVTVIAGYVVGAVRARIGS